MSSRDAVLVILIWALGAWLVYLPFRSLKTGAIQYKGNVYTRSVNPFWFWLYTIAAGVTGLFLIAGSLALFGE